ncbi:hypothetical protein SGPA1_10971 [Streptomyces misionensis JCM 4497]
MGPGDRARRRAGRHRLRRPRHRRGRQDQGRLRLPGQGPGRVTPHHPAGAPGPPVLPPSCSPRRTHGRYPP